MKTYKQFKKFLRDKCWNERDYGEWIYDKLIYDFLVEEVKENKELTDKCDIQDKTPHATDTNVAHSIPQKIKEEVERRITHWSSVPVKQNCYKDILDLLTSLETPQFTPWQEEQKTSMKIWEKTFEITIKSI